MQNPGVDVLWIARYDYPAGWGLKPHHHNYYQLIFFLDGKGVFTVEERPYHLSGNELFLLRPGETHGLRAETLVRTLDVKFRVARGALARQLAEAERMRVWSDPGMAARFERIRMEGDRKHPWYRELCGLLLAEMLYLYLRQGSGGVPETRGGTLPEPAEHDSVLARALEFMRANFARPLTIRDVARHVGYTDRTLRLHFRHALQSRPLAYLQRIRIERAKELIQYSDYTLKEIAEQVGFQTVHHFTRMFSGIEGQSPAAWRREYLGGIRKDVYIHPRFANVSFTVRE